MSAWYISIEGLLVVAGQTQHTAAFIVTWHIIIVSPPDAAAVSQHTAAYISARLIILASPPPATGRLSAGTARCSVWRLVCQ